MYDDFYYEKIKKSIEENNFKYSPYLGHVYCPAIIQDLKIHDANVIDDAQKDKVTSSLFWMNQRLTNMILLLELIQ